MTFEQQTSCNEKDATLGLLSLLHVYYLPICLLITTARCDLVSTGVEFQTLEMSFFSWPRSFHFKSATVKQDDLFSQAMLQAFHRDATITIAKGWQIVDWAHRPKFKIRNVCRLASVWQRCMNMHELLVSQLKLKENLELIISWSLWAHMASIATIALSIAKLSRWQSATWRYYLTSMELKVHFIVVCKIVFPGNCDNFISSRPRHNFWKAWVKLNLCFMPKSCSCTHDSWSVLASKVFSFISKSLSTRHLALDSWLSTCKD